MKFYQINLINDFTVIYFMHKKYQEIPSQIISRYGSKFLIKRQLIESKFQWIMKYMVSQKEQNQNHAQNTLPKKYSEPFHNRQKTKFFQERINPSALSKQIKNQRKKIQEQKDKQNGLYSKIYRIITKRENNENQSRIFVEKSELNNRSISIPKGGLKKNLILFNSRQISRKSALKHATLNNHKQNTQHSFQHYKSQADSGVEELSPWKHSRMAGFEGEGQDEPSFKYF